MSNRLFARTALCALLALSLSACAAISSRPALGVDNNPTGQTRGMPYYLPKGLLRVSIVVAPLGEFRVTVAAPIMVPDRDFLLHADIRHGALSDDLTIVKIDPKTSLLTSADVTSTGRAAEFAENLVKGFGMLQASGGEGGQVIFSALYDFDDLPNASAEASKALHAFIASKCDKFAGLTDADFARVRKESAIAAQDDIVELQADLDRCRRWAVSGIDMEKGDNPYVIQLELLDSKDLALASDRRDMARCRSGLCYRPLRPVGIKTVIAGLYRQDDVFMVPDRGTVSYYALRTGAFANQKYQLKFDQGALIDVNSDTKSELVGFSTLPIKLITAIIAAPGAALGLKSTALKSQDDYLTAVEAHNAKVLKSRETCSKDANACPDTALKILELNTGQQRSDGTSGDRGATGTVPGATTPPPAGSSGAGSPAAADDEGNGPVSTGDP